MRHIARNEMVIFPQCTVFCRRSVADADRIPFGARLGLGSCLSTKPPATVPGRDSPILGSWNIGFTGLEVGARLQAMGSATALGCHS